jgi:gamma-glutamylcyclotransferase (GGCT)/AIG2-like uncharacterized protein YtfP
MERSLFNGIIIGIWSVIALLMFTALVIHLTQPEDPEYVKAGFTFMNEINETLFVDMYVMNGGEWDLLDNIELPDSDTVDTTIKWEKGKEYVTVFCVYTDAYGEEYDTIRYVVQQGEWRLVLLL